tara:strand:+ start:5470 stop:5985 length:516 start_codon:yes stop_codon:yes gene_type:complete
MELEEKNSKELDKMAKISKKALKSVVKDCLVEILQEGLMVDQSVGYSSNSDKISALNEHRAGLRSQQQNTQHTAPRRTGLDNISYNSSEKNHPKLEESKIKAASQSLTSDPVLSSIFEDTARTTLQNQYRAETQGPSAGQGDAASRAAAAADPTELFSESANKWAALAFSE